MNETARADLEVRIRALCANGDFDAAATAVLRGYGPEILGFLVAVHTNEADARDAFSDLAEAVWRGLPRFAWESSARTWSYGVARNITRTRRRDTTRRARHVVSANDSFLQEVVEHVRTETLPFLRTERKTRLQALRDALPEEDRMLLVLRVDRRLSWNELARVLAESEDDAPLDEAAVSKEAARLRKRFQLVKERLREQAKREGLIE